MTTPTKSAMERARAVWDESRWRADGETAAVNAIAAALDEVRLATIEECAKEIEARFSCTDHGYDEAVAKDLVCASAIARTAAVIRALAEKEGGR